MPNQPTYEELAQRIRDLEQELARTRAEQDPGTDPRTRQYLAAILDNTNLPIYLKDADFRYLLINREFERLAGITCDQIRGKDDFAVFPEPIARLFREQDEEVRRGNALRQYQETIPPPGRRGAYLSHRQISLA